MPSSCKKCNTAITPTVPSLKCCICGVHNHIKCLDISKAQFELMKTISGLDWKCLECRGLNSTNANASKCKCCEIIPELKIIIDKLSQSVELLKNQLSRVKETPSAIEFEEVVQEVTDRQIRKSNLIMFGVPEQASKMSSADRKVSDESYVNNFLFQFGETSDIISSKCNRIGRFEPTRAAPRPMRVYLENGEQVVKLLRGIRKNRDIINENQIYKNVRVSLDKTPKQRSYYKKIRQELQERKNGGEEGLIIKYIRGIPRVMVANKRSNDRDSNNLNK
ncbi:hypothetical protein Zmor_022772 [Zophobas morio]|uniref:Zinc finger PHD-type domain-containing protein n=1 Tax=Zophobas morio TaxID=2755281 RepID=A0AA38HW03_9CUCU|nr:hypothetical protein Zmor_022772 [Zophobas morio]